MDTDFLFTRTRTPQGAYGAAGDAPWPDEPFPSPRPFERAAYDRSAYPGRRTDSSRPARWRWQVGAAAALLFVALCACVALGTVALSDAAAGLLDGTGTGRGEGALGGALAAESTPKDQWRRGMVPALYQTDGEWSAIPYGDGTIATHGCGPTSLSMAYVALTGKADRDPAAMAAFAEEHGYLDGGVTSWLLMSAGASELGLSSEMLPSNPEAVRDALLADHPVICSVGPGDFTTDGHFIVLVDANPDGTVTLRDPNSPERTAQTWELDRVLNQCLNLWEMTR